MNNKNKIQEESEQDFNSLSLEELIDITKKLSDNNKPYEISKKVENIKAVFYQKIKSISDLQQDNKDPNNILEIEFKKALNIYKKKKAIFRKQKEEEENKNLQEKKKIIEEIRKLTKEKESIKKTFEKFKELQKNWRSIGHVPLYESNNIWQSYHHHVEIFYDFIQINKDLRDLDFKRNLEKKTTICEKTEKLINEKSIKTIHEKLQNLHEEWKNIGPVKRELREELWKRFQEASKANNKRINDYFTAKKKENQEKLNQKNNICNKIDSLLKTDEKSHIQWNELTKKCEQLQNEWKKIGKLSKEENKIGWKKFRNTLDNFYKNKQLFYKKQKETQKKLIKKRILICEELEKLENNTNWKLTTNKIITLQKEWQSLGYTRKNDKLLKRFQKSCNNFFNNKKSYYNKINQNKKKNLDLKRTLLNNFKEITTKDHKIILDNINKIIEKWKQFTDISDIDSELNNELIQLIKEKYIEIKMKPHEIEEKLFKNKINILSKEKLNKEYESLKIKIKNIEQEIHQYENNISFFSDNKETNSLLKKALTNIKNAVENKELLEKKVNILAKNAFKGNEV